MKFLYSIVLSLLSFHVLMLCLTFIKNVEGFIIKVEFFEILTLRRQFSKIEKDGLPVPLPLPIPPSQTKYSSSSYTDDHIKESFDKTLPVSRPTLNPEEVELSLHITPAITRGTLETLSSEGQEDLHFLPVLKSNNDTNEHNSMGMDGNFSIENEIEDDSVNTTHYDTKKFPDSYNDTDELEELFMKNEYAENNTISNDSYDYDYDENLIDNNSFNTSEHQLQIRDNITLDSNGTNKTEILSLRIFKKMFDPRQIDLPYFFGGVAAVISIVGALTLTRKLYKPE